MWFGAQLALLVLLSLVSVALRGQDLFYQLLLQLTLVLIFTCVQAYKQPHIRSVVYDERTGAYSD